MMAVADVLRLARLYCKAQDISLSTLGRRIAGNNQMFKRLAAGHGVSTRSLEQIEAWFGENWPDEVPWPNDITQAQHLDGRIVGSSEGVSLISVSGHPELSRLVVDQIVPWRLGQEIWVKLKELELAGGASVEGAAHPEISVVDLGP